MERLGSEAYLRSILMTMPDAMIVIDDHGRIISFSPSAERMFGFIEADLLGEKIDRLMPSPDGEHHGMYLSRYLATNDPHIIGTSRVTSARRYDGTIFPIEMSVGEAQIDGSRIFTGFIRDLTVHHRAELRLHELKDELAHVSRVTAMGALATSIAHELNQPLTAIANYVETAGSLLAAPEPAELEMIREALDDCAQQAIRAGQILRRLRNFVSRGETDRLIVGIDQIVDEASALAFLGVGHRSLDFTVEMEPGEPQVLADRIQIEQVFVNLIRNAVEAMERSPVQRLAISSRRRDGMLLLAVEDSGPGIAAGMQERLFQPFTSTKSTGMGVGLSICRSIVESHGGRIWSEPSALGGTALKFTLPEVVHDEG